MISSYMLCTHCLLINTIAHPKVIYIQTTTTPLRRTHITHKFVGIYNNMEMSSRPYTLYAYKFKCICNVHTHPHTYIYTHITAYVLITFFHRAHAKLPSTLSYQSALGMNVIIIIIIVVMISTIS